MKVRALILLLIVSAAICASASAETIPPLNKVPFTSAEKIAAEACKGKITSSGFEQRAGTWFYTFEIKDHHKKFEVLVDALTGNLRSVEQISSR
jgi:uncharacterized membrane protein YkoI